MDPVGRLYRLLLRLYPGPFRELYGREMLEAFRALHRRVVREEGAAGVARLWLRTVRDAAATGVGERLARRGYRRPGGTLRRPRTGALAWLRDLGSDLRYALRTLSRAPGYAAVVVLTLALGIGANAAVFSMVDGVLLEPLPYGDGSTLVHLRHERSGAMDETLGFSVEELDDLRSELGSVEGLAEYHSMTFTLTGHGEPERVRVGVVSHGFFDLLGIRPALGRDFVAAEDRPGASPVLLLAHDYWRERFGGDPDVVGRTVTMNGAPHRIVGVLPDVPQFPQGNDVYMPISVCPTRSGPAFQADRSRRMMLAFARLAPGTTLGEARRDAGEAAGAMVASSPGHYRAGVHRVDVEEIREELVGGARPALLLLLGATGFVLLIACANAANLALARAGGRGRELAVRAALGAGRGRLARQLLAENLLLAVVGGAVGLLLAVGGVELLVAVAREHTPRAGEVEVDRTVLLFTLGVSVATGLLFGAAPAFSRRLRFARAAPRTLGTGAGASAGRGPRRLRGALVVSQVAVTFALLCGAGLMLRSLLELQGVDPGVDAEVVVAAEVIPGSAYADRAALDGFFRRVVADLRLEPGVASVSRSRAVPLEPTHWHARRFYGPTDEPPDRATEPLLMGVVPVVDAAFFRTVGVEVLAGRGLRSADTLGAPPVGVVSEAFVREAWPGTPLEEAPGREVRACWDGGCDPVVRVVGVVEDVRGEGVERPPPPALYYHGAQTAFGGEALLVRVDEDRVDDVAAAIGPVVHAVDPDVPVTEVVTLEGLRQRSLANPRLLTRLLGLFALVALGLTLAGLFGVLSLAVGARAAELGVRRALGARPGEVGRLVLREGLVLVVAGLGLGVVLALGLTRSMGALLWGVEPWDVTTLGGALLLFLAAGVAACWLPARRAARRDPLEALGSP